VQKLAQEKGVEIRLYDIIYDAVDDIKKAMEVVTQQQSAFLEFDLTGDKAESFGMICGGKDHGAARLYRFHPGEQTIF
jgi:hypothetical protein